MTIKTNPLHLTAADYRDRNTALRRDLRTATRWNRAYRWLALVGWAAFVTVLLVPDLAHGGDCEKLAAFKQNQARKLQGDYMRLKVPPAQWVEFLKASDKLIDDRYAVEMEKCKVKL